MPDGSKSHLHLFDAKFRVHGLADVGLAGSDKDGDDEKAGERAGSFKRGDIYKMHAYRDAIPDARSVWIMYPGGEFRFFGIPGNSIQSGNQAVSSPDGLPDELGGCWRDSRLLRLSGTRRAVVGEGQPPTMVCCERHCDGCSGPEA